MGKFTAWLNYIIAKWFLPYCLASIPILAIFEDMTASDWAVILSIFIPATILAWYAYQEAPYLREQARAWDTNVTERDIHNTF